MRLSASNIGWLPTEDHLIYNELIHNGFSAIEIAPSRSFSSCYDTDSKEMLAYLSELHNNHLSISSMQSLLYQDTTKIFNNEFTIEKTLDKMRTVLDFAQKLQIPNLVFGCPKNRNMSDIEAEKPSALYFFTQLAKMALKKHIVISLEPNPPIYQTNFLNSTMETLNYVKSIQHPCLKMNLDLGTVFANVEDLSEIITAENIPYIHHVHISEPFLSPLTTDHNEVYRLCISLLNQFHYENYISIEMKQSGQMIASIQLIGTLFKEVTKK